MKRIMILPTATLLCSLNAFGTTHVGQCVFPKTRTVSSGDLSFRHPIYVSDAPDSTGAKHLLIALSTFLIKSEAHGGYIFLVTIPDYGQTSPYSGADKPVGWAKLSDFRLQDLRNCNYRAVRLEAVLALWHSRIRRSK
jgi:hypothetical protein